MHTISFRERRQKLKGVLGRLVYSFIYLFIYFNERLPQILTKTLIFFNNTRQIQRTKSLTEFTLDMRQHLLLFEVYVSYKLLCLKNFLKFNVFHISI